MLFTILGYILIFLPFVLFFIFVSRNDGFKAAAIVFSLTMLVVTLVVLGLYLISLGGTSVFWAK
jgi:hypothetical protein